MNPPSEASQPTGKNAVSILLLAVLLCVGYAMLCALLHWRADFAESNFQSNLLRTQRYLFGPKPDAVLAGSSITGRLLPKYFTASGWQVANLGLDGSGSSLGVEIIRRRPDPPPLVFVEVNSLLRKPNRNDAILSDAINDPSFALAKAVAICRAEQRPSALLYNVFKTYNDRRLSEHAGSSTRQPLSAVTITAPEKPLGALPDSLAAIETNLKALQSAGAHTVFLRVPAGGPPPAQRQADLADEFVAKMGARQIEALTLADGESMIFTDGLHLASKSAATVSQTIVKQTPPK